VLFVVRIMTFFCIFSNNGFYKTEGGVETDPPPYVPGYKPQDPSILFVRHFTSDRPLSLKLHPSNFFSCLP